MQLKKKAICEHCGYDEKKQNDIHQLQIGTLLNDHYLIGRVLSQRQQEIQYLAWDQSLSSPVTIKEYFPANHAIRDEHQKVSVSLDVSAPHFAFDRGRQQFIENAKAIAHLASCPEIIHVRNRFRENNTEYVVTEFAQGTSLHDHIRKHGPLSLESACTVLGPVMKTLSQAHRGGLFHQNINPDNIILLPGGGVKLLHFGSLPYPEDSANEKNHRSGKSGFVESFVPAELYQGNYVPGPRTDVYGICGTIYFCLTGKTPSGFMSDASKKTELARLKKKLYDHQIDILRSGMAEDPQRRPPTMDQLHLGMLGYSFNQTTADPDATIIVSQSTGAEEYSSINSRVWEKTWTGPPKRFPLIPVIVSAAAVLAVAAAVGFFTYHVWEAPGCTSPSVCRICGKQGSEPALGHSWANATCTLPKTCTRCSEVSGAPLGHTWEDAACDAPKTCTTCGQTDGSPLGHDWQDASYTDPKQCKRCALTEGDPKGYIGNVSGTWSKERFYLEETSGNIYELEQPIENCKQFTLTVGVTNVQYGSVLGSWGIFGRNQYGGWDEIGQFELLGDEISVTFEFEHDAPITFDAIVALPYEKYFGNYGKRITVSEVQVYVD